MVSSPTSDFLRNFFGAKNTISVHFATCELGAKMAKDYCKNICTNISVNLFHILFTYHP